MDKKPTTLNSAFLIYIITIVFLITLAPFNFRIPETVQITGAAGLADGLTNLFLFIPIGFFSR